MGGGTMKIEVPDSVLAAWQGIADLLAEVIGVPAALVMRLSDPDIEVLVASRSAGNPYRPGEKEHFEGSGLYCETVIRTNGKLLVPDARADDRWKNNPDVRLDMVSYLGYPILLPDGTPFGTICVLDDKENRYSATYENLILKFRNLIQENLGILYMNQVLGDRN